MPDPRATRILVWMCVLIAVNQLGFGAIVPVIALYARSFGVAQAAIGIAIAVYGLARFLVAVPVGKLTDVVGRRAALALGGLVTAAGNFLCAEAPNFATFVAARFVAGVGAALVLIAGQIVLADITTPARRGRVMAIYQGVFLFAVGVGPYPGGVLADRFGLTAPFLVYAVAGAVASAVAWLSIPDTRAPGASTGDAAAPPLAFAAQIRQLAAHPGFLLVSLVGFVNAVVRTGALFNVVPVLARDRLRLGTDRIGFGLALASVVGLAFAYPAGVLVDRYGRKTVIVPATATAGLSMIVFLAAPSYAWFLGGCVMWSVAVGVSGAAPAAYAADVAPSGMNAAAMSTYRMLSDLGYVIGPIALGAATDVFGADAALGASAALMVAVAALFARRAPETYRSVR
ncbi:MAG TPA: MFS transporter [Methylomirabilota bacterium]|nr:MFS transporter [Methylomirabilota bacterium]